MERALILETITLIAAAVVLLLRDVRAGLTDRRFGLSI